MRIFFGNAGPNATASMHKVGEIFTRYYEFGSLSSPPLEGIQTATIPPGYAGNFEVKASVPGQFTFMDHAMSRMEKGDMAFLEVNTRKTPPWCMRDHRGIVTSGPIYRRTLTTAGLNQRIQLRLLTVMTDGSQLDHRGATFVSQIEATSTSASFSPYFRSRQS